MTNSLVELFTRDLSKLKKEMSEYSDASDRWKAIKGTSNSGGNLCLHLVGNLKHFIGAILGNSGYTRNRDAEFKNKNIAMEILDKEIDETITIIASVLPGLTDEDLNADFPVDVFKQKMSTSFFLLHLVTHLNYHLGQINYHRRFIESNKG